MTNDNLPATTGDVPTIKGELEMNDWLRKLKENQDRRKEERLRKYSDVISKFIIVLILICIFSFIVIAALAIENNNLYKQNDQLRVSYNSLNDSKNDQINKLTSDNKDLQSYIFSNRTLNNIDYTVYVDQSLPKISKITFNNNMMHLEFADGSPAKDVYFIDNTLYVNNAST